MIDGEGVFELFRAFWGGADGTPEGSVRGDLRKGDWGVLRWVLGWDESAGRDYAWWCTAGGVEPLYLARRLLAEWTPTDHGPCRRCGHGYDRVAFQFPSRQVCMTCERTLRWKDKERKRA